jgi:hypothetical protein
MKTKDFEMAIDALCVQDVVIDEMKMKANSGGHIRQVNGHTTKLNVVWDEMGRAFTTPRHQESEEFIEMDSGKAVAGFRLERDSDFDLKFD